MTLSAGRSTLISCCAASILLTSLQSRAADLKTRVDGYRSAHEAAIVAQLDELTRLKSVAADRARLR